MKLVAPEFVRRLGESAAKMPAVHAGAAQQVVAVRVHPLRGTGPARGGIARRGLGGCCASAEGRPWRDTP